MYLACEGDQMVLAETEDLNVLDDDQLVVIFVKDGAVNDVSQVLLVTLCEVHHGFCIAFRSAMETFSFGILADAFKECTDGARQLFLASGRLFGRGFESFARASTCVLVRNLKAESRRSQAYWAS